ncbi:MAG: O-antigen ligase family protein [Erysipelotrichaceae bacterium]|nr:O-antigen ligase family protein [Erysipelotrichaceae bacterium]
MSYKQINSIITELLIILLAINYMIVVIVLKDNLILSSLRDVLLLLLLLLTVKNNKVRIDKPAFFIIGFMILALLSLFNTDSLMTGILSIRRYYFPVLFLLCINNIGVDDIDHSFINYMIKIIAFLSAWGIFQADILGDSFLRKIGYPLVYSYAYGREMLYNSFYFGNLGIQRVVSTFSSSNIYGLCSGMVLIASIILYKFINIKHKNLLILIITIGYLLSFSRSNFLALLILFILYLRKYIPNKKIVYLSIAILMMVFIVVGVSQGNSGILYKIFTWVIDTFSGRESSSAGRSGIWKAAFIEAVNHPFGIGYGHVGAMANSDFAANQVFSAENSYLTISLDIGWLGVIFYVFFLVSLIKKLRRYSVIFKNESDYYGNKLCVCGYTILIYLSIVMFFSNHIQDMEAICFAYVFVGIALKYIYSHYIKARK